MQFKTRIRLFEGSVYINSFKVSIQRLYQMRLIMDVWKPKLEFEDEIDYVKQKCFVELIKLVDIHMQ